MDGWIDDGWIGARNEIYLSNQMLGEIPVFSHLGPFRRDDVMKPM